MLLHENHDVTEDYVNLITYVCNGVLTKLSTLPMGSRVFFLSCHCKAQERIGMSYLCITDSNKLYENVPCFNFIID